LPDLSIFSGKSQNLLPEGVEPSVVTCNTAISAFGRRSQWWLALQQLQRWQLDLLAFNAAIAACAKHWQWALQLLIDMETYGCERDVISYNSTISALSFVFLGLPMPA